MATAAKTKKAPARRPAVKKKAAPAPIPVAVAERPVTPVKRTYRFAVGRRKEAVARVRWYPQGDGAVTVNQRTLVNYFPLREHQELVTAPLVLTHQTGRGQFSIKVAGGGTQGQAEAIRLGLARVLVQSDGDLRLPLKRAGYLRRDPRIKERKKYGLKRARRAPQWQKR